MYARTTTVRGDRRAVDDGIADVRDEVWPMLQQIEGCIGVSMLVDRSSGRCIITSAWVDEQALNASADRVRESRRRAAEVMRAEKVDVQDWEIARIHRLHPAPEGASVRVTWTRGDATQLDRSLDAFGMSILPRLDDLPGFCSVSQLVDRSMGRSVLAACYADRDAMDRASRQVAAMRQELMDDTGIELMEVAEFDLALAHLRVPELA
jgi:S-adenosylmethionine/arginine decarboxylase-like enzyme